MGYCVVNFLLEAQSRGGLLRVKALIS